MIFLCGNSRQYFWYDAPFSSTHLCSAIPADKLLELCRLARGKHCFLTDNEMNLHQANSCSKRGKYVMGNGCRHGCCGLLGDEKSSDGTTCLSETGWGSSSLSRDPQTSLSPFRSSLPAYMLDYMKKISHQPCLQFAFVSMWLKSPLIHSTIDPLHIPLPIWDRVSPQAALHRCLLKLW